jgi:hypothetical protein
MSGHVIKELVDAVACVFSRSSLLASNSRECHENSGINSTYILEEAPRYYFGCISCWYRCCLGLVLIGSIA